MDWPIDSCPAWRPCNRVRSARAGLTLLEVLVTMAILTIGLLGVLALFALAYRSVAEANKADRVRACGEWASRQVYLQDMLNSSQWRNADLTTFTPDATTPMFLIDPVFMARNPGLSASDVSTVPAATATALRRRTPALPGGMALTVTWASARCFVSEDDLVFSKPDDQGLRPKMLFRTSTGDTTENLTPTPLTPSSNPEYSWFLTVTPNPTLSARVAVCHRRDFNPFAEQVATVASSSWGTGMGEVELLPGDFDIREGSWVLVHGTPTSPPATPADNYQWLQVIAVIRPDASGNGHWALTLEDIASWNSAYTAVHVIVIPGVESVSNPLTP